MKSPKRKILLLDIETAPMHVRLWDLKVRGWVSPKMISQSGYVLCFAAKWLGQKQVDFIKTSDGHEKMLRKMHECLSNADAVIHYNGKKFDIPILNAEFLLSGIDPVENLPVQIDLLPMVRRTFKLPSNSLDYVAGVLGIGQKVKHEGIKLWEDCEAAREKPRAEVWGRMAKYNRNDVVLLEKLYHKLRPWFPYTHGYKRIHEWLSGQRSKP